MQSDRSRPRVLIVDDNVHTVELLRRALRRHEYAEVASAESISEALELLPSLLPDAVLVDLGLPLLDGRSFLQHVRRSPRWAALTVLVLGGRYSAPAIRAATQDGANAFIHQPFDGSEIVYKIEQAVRGVGPRAAELTDLLAVDDGGRRST